MGSLVSPVSLRSWTHWSQECCMPIFCSQYTTSHPTRWTRRQLQDAYEVMLSICIDDFSQICIVGNYIILYLCICICIDSINMFLPKFPQVSNFSIYLGGAVHMHRERGQTQDQSLEMPGSETQRRKKDPSAKGSTDVTWWTLDPGKKAPRCTIWWFSNGISWVFNGDFMGF